VDGDKPIGGKWSFDRENRKKLPKNITIPKIPQISPNTYVLEAQEYVTQNFADHWGSVANFSYPTTHREATNWLQDFLTQRFANFGDYEDAMSIQQDIIFHGVLTPMLNIGLLTPEQVISETLNYAESHPVGLNTLEGFVRQIIGWREFMAGMYLRIGTAQRNRNFWEHHRPIPASFYTGTTGILPLDHVIKKVLQTAYCHHIERLMVLGNFMLLCEIHPQAIYQWFMEFFIDSYDWVMVPNVYGMSQYSDGGWMTTKPYISGSNYLRKMSDFPAGYQVQEARNGVEAIKQVGMMRPDLIILDVMMPEVNGFDVAAALKKNPTTANIPIIILSIVEDRQKGYRLGVERYITKPFLMDNLLQEVNHLLAQGSERKKVLVVSHNQASLKSLTQALEKQGDILIEVAHPEAVNAQVQQFQPDMIIMDTLDAQGYQLARDLRLKQGLENVFFMLVTDQGSSGQAG